MRFKQAVIEYSLKHGVTAAAIRYKTTRQNIYRWRKKYDGAIRSLADRDKYGLLVIECIPGWQYFNDDPTFSERLYQVEREMIRRDRNHPSVILWETALNETYYPLEVVKKIYEIAHDEYPGNQMYTSNG